MKKTITLTYPAGPERVAAMLADPDYQRKRAERAAPILRQLAVTEQVERGIETCESCPQLLGGFGVDRETKRAQWEELMPVVARMMVEEPFAGVDGTTADRRVGDDAAREEQDRRLQPQALLDRVGNE